MSGRIAAAVLMILALTGCQQRLGGLAPFSVGGGGSAGGAVTVAPGDSLYAVSRRYEVPLRDLIEINNLAPPYLIEPGQRLVLPTARQYIVQPGDTLYGVSRMFSVDLSELSRLNNLPPPYAIRSGQPLRLPSPAAGYAENPTAGAPTQLAAAPRPKIERIDLSPPSSAPAVSPAPAGAPFNPAAPSVIYQPGQEPKTLGAGGGVASVPTAVQAPVAPAPVDPSPAQKPAKKPDVATSAAAPASPPPPVAPTPVATAVVMPPPRPAADAEPPPRGAGKFLMPVKGSIISGFGPKPGGQHNDGLNIAAAKGTPVVAADNGVVAYAGNELRGFGNLLLIRHADGWVTAYAHLDLIDVERGAQVKRGQKIGTVGQSGGVPTPQLHFELRKGSQAVDPKGRM